MQHRAKKLDSISTSTSWGPVGWSKSRIPWNMKLHSSTVQCSIAGAMGVIGTYHIPAGSKKAVHHPEQGRTKRSGKGKLRDWKTLRNWEPAWPQLRHQASESPEKTFFQALWLSLTFQRQLAETFLKVRCNKQDEEILIQSQMKRTIR